jgi:tagatose 1,6-diphosphate aldolase
MEWKYEVGHRFSGKEVDVVIEQRAPADPQKGWVPAYALSIRQKGTDITVGGISARIGYTDNLVKYGGQIGYGVDEAYRGHHYAAKGCRLVDEIFRAHGMDVVWITCNPENRPSRRTCEILGCTFVEIVDLPPDNDMYLEGERQKCRYRRIIY